MGGVRPPASAPSGASGPTALIPSISVTGLASDGTNVTCHVKVIGCPTDTRGVGFSVPVQAGGMDISGAHPEFPAGTLWYYMEATATGHDPADHGADGTVVMTNRTGSGSSWEGDLQWLIATDVDWEAAPTFFAADQSVMGLGYYGAGGPDDFIRIYTAVAVPGSVASIT